MGMSAGLPGAGGYPPVDKKPARPMKMENTRSLGKKSLPGDRQGVSGADAGHDSMRTVGGRVLTRRAPATQTTTAEPNHQREGHTRPRAPPAEGAAQEYQPALTQAGRPRQRLKWTMSMNETVVRLYYKVTELERNLAGYRQRLHAEFCIFYPNITVTEQRVADQYRVILRNNLIPETRRNIIKREIQAEIDPVPNLEDAQNTVEQVEQLKKKFWHKIKITYMITFLGKWAKHGHILIDLNGLQDQYYLECYWWVITQTARNVWHYD